MVVNTFKDFRDAKLNCKATNTTFKDVEQCMLLPRIEMATVLKQDNTTKGLFLCDPDIKRETNYVDDLAELAKNGSFDVWNITEANPLVTDEGIMCHGGNQDETSIDLIELGPEASYLVKSGGSFSDATSDIVAYHEVMQIAGVLGEDIPDMVWANPTTGRFAMTNLKGDQPNASDTFEDINPHEWLTSLVFESLIADSDRNVSNFKTIAPGALGHIDFGGAFVGVRLAGEPGSDLANGFSNYVKNYSIQLVEALRPGLTQAIEETYIKWRTEWRPTFTEMGPGFRSARKTRRLATPSTADASDASILLTAENLNLTEKYLETLVKFAELDVQTLKNKASRIIANKKVVQATANQWGMTSGIGFRVASSGTGSTVCDEINGLVNDARRDLKLLGDNNNCSQKGLQTLSDIQTALYVRSRDMNPLDCPNVWDIMLDAYRQIDTYDYRCRTRRPSDQDVHPEEFFNDIVNSQDLLLEITEETGLQSNGTRPCDTIPFIDRRVTDTEKAFGIAKNMFGPPDDTTNADITLNFSMLKTALTEARGRCS